MVKNILIIDDEDSQAKNLSSALNSSLEGFCVEYASTKEEIDKKVIGKYYSIAIVDLRMDGLDIDGFSIIDNISEYNPNAKIIAISAYINEYIEKLNDYLSANKIIAISEKELDYAAWIPKLTKIIINYSQSDDRSYSSQSLDRLYGECKNETDTYQKGVKFEEFVSILFSQMGFRHISKRIKDDASNEIDLVVRNDIDDNLLNKYKRYIFVECKNKPTEGFCKNDFIVFNSKIESSFGDCDLGVVFTTGYIKNTVPKEALKESRSNNKIIFCSQPEIEKLINSSNMLEAFKHIIDEQVK